MQEKTKTTAKGMMNLGDYGKMIEPETTREGKLADALRKLIEEAILMDERIDGEWGFGEYKEDKSITDAKEVLSLWEGGNL